MRHLIQRLCFLLLLAIPSLAAAGTAGPPADVPFMRDLDLHYVQFVIVAPSAFRAQLHDRAMKRFAEAGLPLPPTGTSPASFDSTLTLSLDPISAEDRCPNSVLYAPSLTLREPVAIVRNSVVVRDNTWSTQLQPQVMPSVSVGRLEADVDGLLAQFIAQYQHEHPDWASQPPRQASASAPSFPEAGRAQEAAGLKNLTIDAVQLSVLANRFSTSLATRARQHLADAGLPISSDRRDAPVVLSLELIQQALDDQCPGHVLYESGLYLVEEVRILRNPLHVIWSDTWASATVQLVPSVPLRQLESDHDALLDQFIHAMQQR